MNFMKIRYLLSPIIFLSLVTVFFVSLANAQQATVVVAANMKPAMEEIYQQYKIAGGQDLRIIYGSSGNFARQIQQGAPFHLFVSADERFTAFVAVSTVVNEVDPVAPDAVPPETVAVFPTL